MTLTRRFLILLASGGSAALLLGAWTFQYFGWAPCQMCIWQRYPHAAAVLIGAAALALPGRVLPLLGAVAALVTAGIGVFHSGVERKWWEGITECAGSGGIANTPIEDLLNPAIEAGPPLVRCDAFDPVMFGLTMANANALISIGLAVLWVLAARRSA